MCLNYLSFIIARKSDSNSSAFIVQYPARLHPKYWRLHLLLPSHRLVTVIPFKTSSSRLTLFSTSIIYTSSSGVLGDWRKKKCPIMKESFCLFLGPHSYITNSFIALGIVILFISSHFRTI